jgi:precorrin-2 dehydrogenase / sirohydrochlorin ferrochelatase
MKYYPIFLDLRRRSCLVIGGGGVAERKVLSLLEAGAEVTIVSPTLSQKLQDLSSAGKITHRKKHFDENDLIGSFLVFGATDSPEVNTAAARLCRKKNLLVNVAAPPGESSFIVPSVVERGDLLIAVSTSGASPALSKKVRQELEKTYGPEYDLLLARLAAIRKRLLDEVPDESARKKVFQAIVDSDVLDLLRQGKTHAAGQRMADIAGLKDRG